MSAFTFVACHQLDFEIWREIENVGIELRNQSVCIELPPPQNSNKSAANMINKGKQRITKTRSTALNAIDLYGSDGRLTMFAKCVKSENVTLWQLFSS